MNAPDARVEYSLLSKMVAIAPNETMSFVWSLLPTEEPIGLDVRNFGKAEASLDIASTLFDRDTATVDVWNTAHRTARVQLALHVVCERERPDLGTCHICSEGKAVVMFMNVPHCNRCAP